MQFLKTLFWVILAVTMVLFASVNWVPATITLWGGLQADVKLPVLVILAFLIGFLPTFLLYRARLWSLKRRLETLAQTHVANTPGPAHAGAAAPAAEAERLATDSRVWPTA